MPGEVLELAARYGDYGRPETIVRRDLGRFGQSQPYTPQLPGHSGSVLDFLQRLLGSEFVCYWEAASWHAGHWPALLPDPRP